MKYKITRLVGHLEEFIVEASNIIEADLWASSCNAKFVKLQDDYTLEFKIKEIKDQETPEQAQIDAVKKTLKNRIVP